MQEGNPPEATEQQREEKSQPHPHGVYVEVPADAGADASQLGVLRVAVETARDARGVAVQVGVRRLGNVLGGAHLADDILDERLLDDAGVVLRREDQFGDARLDVGDDLRPVGRILVGAFQALEIGGQLFVGVGVQRERHARNTAFLDLFHGFACLGDGFSCGCCRRSICSGGSSSRPSNGSTNRSRRWRGAFRSSAPRLWSRSRCRSSTSRRRVRRPKAWRPS